MTSIGFSTFRGSALELAVFEARLNKRAANTCLFNLVAAIVEKCQSTLIYCRFL